ncbi:MAG: hypothetical protein ACK5VI_02785 [Opitutia bacterium]|jgi:hypothetical protein
MRLAMATAKEAAMSFEAVKVSMRQDGKGSYITLALHPNQVPLDLFAAPAGSRFGCALVHIDENEEPVKGRDAEEGDKAMASAGMLCRNLRFQQWIHREGLALDISEDGAIAALRQHCGITSRTELKTNREARKIFLDLAKQFQTAKL